MTRLFVAGTDTGVGKTLVAAGLAKMLSNQGRVVAGFKPIETGVPIRGPLTRDSDAELLQWASGWNAPAEQICPIRLAAPLAPWVAAGQAGTPVDQARIDHAYQRLERGFDDVIVEGCGGLLVPITADMHVIDLVRSWQLPMLLVGRAGLGTINHTGLALEAARARSITVAGVVLSAVDSFSADESISSNRGVIENLFDVKVLPSLPRLPDELTPRQKIERVAEHFVQCGLEFHDLVSN